MTTHDESIVCADCGSELPIDWIREKNPGGKCSHCGSTSQKITMKFQDEMKVGIHDSVRGRVKSKSYSSKKNPRKDFFVGDDERVSTGDYVYKERYIDKDNNSYKERITDKKTGEVIQDVEEPLDKHQGHGSAKFNRDPE